MDTILATLTPEITKTFGAFSSLIILLGFVIWHLRSENKDLRKKVDEHLKTIGDLQETRIREAQELIRVTERSTETQIARSQGDQTHAQLMQLLVAMMRGTQDMSAGNRDLLEQLVARAPRRLPSTIRGGGA